MAIEKNSFKVSRFDSEFSPGSRETMSSDEDELQRRSSAVESDDDEEFDDADSGAGSDDFDLLELGETGAEFCQVGNQTCSIPWELYDLPGLEDILSVDVWNECLSEEERLSLTKFLPDMDQDMYMITLTELFTGGNLHFGSPIKKLFDTLKGGLCEPRVALYREGLNFFQKRQHYHLLRKYQNNMVSNLCQIRDAWLNCRGYSIEERLRVLNIMKSQKSLMYEKMEDFQSDSSERESGEHLWARTVKEKKVAQKTGRLAYGVNSNLDFPSRGRSMDLEPEKHGKPNAKGILKLAGSKPPSAKDMVARYPSVYHGSDMNTGSYGPAAALPRQTRAAGFDSAMALRVRDEMRIGDDAEEMTYGMGIQQDRKVSRGSMMENAGILKMGKKHGFSRGDDLATDGFMGVPLSKTDLLAYGRNRNSRQLSDAKVFMGKPPNMKTPYDFVKKSRYPESVQQFGVGDQMKSLKGRDLQIPLKVNRIDSSDRAEPFWHKRTQGEHDDFDVRSKKWKTGRESPDLSYKSYRASSPHITDRHSLSEFRAELSQEKIKGSFVQNGMKTNRTFMKSEDTESDSSEQFDDDEDSNPLLRSKLAFPVGVMGGSQKSLRSGVDVKRAKVSKKDIKDNTWALDGITHPSKKMGGFGDHGHVRGGENYTSKQKGKMRDSSPLHESATRVLGDSYVSGLGSFNDAGGRKQIHKVGKNGKLRGEPVEKLNMSSLKTYSSERKQKRDASRDRYLHDDVAVEEDDSLVIQLLADNRGQGRFGKKNQSKERHVNDRNGRSEAPLIVCNSVTKKRKGKEDITDMHGRDEDGDLESDAPWQIDDSTPLKRKGKRKLDQDSGSSDMENSELPVTETVAVEMELETKPQKKQFTLITPTVHTGFSFSIIHLLSAVRLAMITPLPEDLEVGKPREEQNINHEVSGDAVPSHEKVDVNLSEHAGQGNVPSLTVQEIVNRVTSNPGDPCILETQEPLQDLVRGVLKIFSSKTAPLGAKGWKALATYEKPTKSWSWIGPVSHSSSDHDTIEEVTSPEAWVLPHKMLVKLVDCFANWLKSGQETLQQIGSLPAPPLALMQFNLDEKERFRDLRAQKSLNTISSSSEEVRSYFRKEEVLRYSIPDRAFSYTAADGRKSIVAPLRRCGGKPTSKARDHFMLKRDRPPHVTILCLVRDAAARLPGSIGTRADVCTLIRDSQYIVEDVSDAQVNQVVSGALDRLHYERDPCVQFDGERKLWVYLHREREEEDFEDDGTSSTKKWKRQKKDAPEQSEQGAVTVAYHGTQDQTGYDLCSDLNIEPSCMDDEKGMEPVDNDVRQDNGDNVDMNHGSELSETHQGHPAVWDAIDINPMRENKLLCQENSTNEDFDDETFGKERSVGLLSASLL
ncbi:Nuclear factor related to kappa-B-binding protein [Morella rubra]|uniref:Nuclear factor related to kappa-B-binding protein n=1 Tax=Morella rubra TaxID=262757 RepID=A0A6A1WQV6_9ROSI|nr:Nuclear factor related to kappa-B-binding protein [Morella rubra]